METYIEKYKMTKENVDMIEVKDDDLDEEEGDNYLDEVNREDLDIPSPSAAAPNSPFADLFDN